VKDCRAFTTQPFARCYVEFDYAGKRCPIYEEFFFNDAAQTFVEAWSNQPGRLPMQSASDKWAEGVVHRLGSKVPMLGGPLGDLDIDDDAFRAAAAKDSELNDFSSARRTSQSLNAELASRPSEEEM
jgi:hypothetical protein